MKFKVETYIDGSKICQITSSDCALNDTWEVISNQVYEVESEQFNEALESLGWISPETAKKLGIVR